MIQIDKRMHRNTYKWDGIPKIYQMDSKREFVINHYRLITFSIFERLNEMTNKEINKKYNELIKMGITKRKYLKDLGLPNIDEVVLILEGDDKEVIDAINDKTNIEVNIEATVTQKKEREQLVKPSEVNQNAK